MKEHHWSGWPGAYCLDCGRGDAWEWAIAMGAYDVIEKKFYPCFEENMTAGQVQEYVEKMRQCPIDFNADCPQCVAKKRK